ncbi:MAG: hypothetical protein R3B47_10490 [Bacteroidia bacterium]
MKNPRQPYRAFAFSFPFSQQNEPVQVKKGVGSIQFFENGKRLRHKALQEKLKVNPGAFNVYKSSQGSIVAGSIIGAVGGGLMGWSIGGAIGGEEFDWTVFGIGVGISAISFVVYESGAKRAKLGVELYNQGLPYAHRAGTEWRLTGSPAGLGLAIRF